MPTLIKYSKIRNLYIHLVREIKDGSCCIEYPLYAILQFDPLNLYPDFINEVIEILYHNTPHETFIEELKSAISCVHWDPNVDESELKTVISKEYVLSIKFLKDINYIL
jgi:c-di-GMP-related signal transduction protein